MTMREITCATVVVGSGCAGLNAADWLAALGAEGETVITGVHHIDRGYAGLEDMVRRLGGTMKRREDTDEAKGA